MSRTAALALALALLPVAGWAGPEIDYMLHCRGCHLADGAGSPGAVPDMRDTLGRFLEVPGGRAFLVQVPGSAQSPLDDATLAALLNWMIREFGPAAVAADFAPYSAEEVARYRAEPLTEVDAVRADLVARFRPGAPPPE